MDKNLVTDTPKKQTTKQVLEIVEALKGKECWCQKSIDNPAIKNHTRGCIMAQKATGMLTDEKKTPEKEVEVFSWSTDGEHYNGDDGMARDEAIQRAVEAMYEEDKKKWFASKIYIGKRVDPMKNMSFDVANTIMEQLGCQANDNYGESVDNWLHLKDEVEAKLNAILTPLIVEFIEENDPPTFYGIDFVEEFKVADFPKVIGGVEKIMEGKEAS